MKKKRTGTLVTLSLTGVMLLTSGCAKYREVGLGEVLVVEKGATFRSTGGGFEDSTRMAGTHMIAGASVTADSYRVPYTPQSIVLDNLPIVMKYMNNQTLKFKLTLTFLVNPVRAWNVVKNFRAYEQEIRGLYQESAIRVLHKLNMGLDLNVFSGEAEGGEQQQKNDEGLDFSSREKIAGMIMQDFRANFARKYPQFRADFVFIDSALNDVEFTGDILRKFESAVAKQYETEVSRYESMLADINGQIDVARSEADLAAYDIEAGALTDEVLLYQANDLRDELVKNPNIEVEMYMLVNEDGTLSQFGTK